MLIDAGVSLHALDKEGFTPRVRAILEGHARVAAMLPIHPQDSLHTHPKELIFSSQDAVSDSHPEGLATNMPHMLDGLSPSAGNGFVLFKVKYITRYSLIIKIKINKKKNSFVKKKKVSSMTRFHLILNLKMDTGLPRLHHF